MKNHEAAHNGSNSILKTIHYIIFFNQFFSARKDCGWLPSFLEKFRRQTSNIHLPLTCQRRGTLSGDTWGRSSVCQPWYCNRLSPDTCRALSAANFCGRIPAHTHKKAETQLLIAYSTVTNHQATFFFSQLHLSLVGNLGCLTWVRLQQRQEQCYPFLLVCAVFSCPNNGVAANTRDLLYTQMLMHAITHCTWGLYGHR